MYYAPSTVLLYKCMCFVKTLQWRHTNGQKDVLQIARHLSLDALLDVLARNLLILLEH